jgi:RNA recognition motif-containing protein
MSLFGAVTGISLNRGFGFVQYEQASSAIEAIKQENGVVFRGKKMGRFCIEGSK